MDFNGTPIDLDKVPDTMGLKGVLVFNPVTSDYEPRYTTFSPNQRWVTYENHTFALNPVDLSKLPQSAGTYRGEPAVPTEKERTAPRQTRQAMVHVTSSPSQADIFVDGKFFGSTPSDITLAAGEHTVKVTAGGKEWSRMVQITAGEIRIHAEIAVK